MGYRHTPNLYRDQTILMFRECYASEKIHGTSSHVAWRDGKVWFHSGGEKHDNFVKLFDEVALTTKFQTMGHESIIVYGEAYGGKQQGQSWRYGKQLKFVAFEAKVGDVWLNVPNAEGLATGLGLEFVHYKRVSTDIEVLNAERDAPSEQAKRNGMGDDKPREGVVIRPLIEVTLNNGDRIIAKHKRDEERETKSPRVVDDPTKLKVIEDAEAIAIEWVTPTRLEHVLDAMEHEWNRGETSFVIPHTWDPSDTPNVIKAMIEDVVREAASEIVDGKEARKAIGKLAAKLFNDRIKRSLDGSSL